MPTQACNTQRVNLLERPGPAHHSLSVPLGRDESASTPRCEHRVVSVREAVNNAVTGLWDVPPFQRRFIWKSWQVRDLADSLWRDYPVGQLLLWKDPDRGGAATRWLVADGQHRLVALCLLFGEQPYWWHEGRTSPARRAARQCDVRFDIEAAKPPFFRAWSREASKSALPSLISLRELLAIDLEKDDGWRQLEQIAARLVAAGYCKGIGASVCERLASVCRIREKQITAAILTHQSEREVLEVFERLSGGGIRFRRLLLRLLARRLF